MKSLIVFLSILITGNPVPAQLKPVNQGSSVQFKIKNFGFSVTGSFTGLEGTVQFDPADIAHAYFNVSIDANTVNTDNNMRDDHLRNDTYFDVKKYPRISFVSIKVTPSSKKGVLFIFGKLTIKNQTKDISFPFTAEASKDGYLFKGTFNINRKDFGVGGSSIISDNLDVALSIFTRQ
jgi:polyisoprenoid-binding protein YceI